MAEGPKIGLYVSSVPGRLVSRPGSPFSYVGAKIPTPEERKAGASEPTWQSEVVVPVLEAEYQRYLLEWNRLVDGGDLEKRTEADFDAYTKAVEKAEAARDAQLEAEAKKVEAERKRLEAESKKGSKEQVANAGSGGGQG